MTPDHLKPADREGLVREAASDLLLVDHYYPMPWTLVEPADDNGAAYIRDRNGASVAMMMWPAHGQDDAERASEATYLAGRMMAAVATWKHGAAIPPKAERVEIPVGSIAVPRPMLDALLDDYQTSEHHHPDHVLVRKDAFDRLAAIVEGSVPTPEAERVEIPAYHVVLKAMREAMKSHPFWRKVKHTPAENDLPVRAANVAVQFMREM